LYNFNCAGVKSPNSTAVPGISIAMDSRLENGIEMSAELRLRVHTYLYLSAALLHALIDHIEQADVSTNTLYLPRVTLPMLGHHVKSLFIIIVVNGCELYDVLCYLHILKI